MSFRILYQLMVAAIVQLGGLWFLFWATQVLLPVIIQELLNGMHTWSTAAVLFSWVIQLCAIFVTLSVRSFLVPAVLQWTEHLPLFYLRILWGLLCFGTCIVLWYLFRQLQTLTTAVDYFVVVEWALIIIQLYLLACIVAPLGSVKGYQWLFRARDTTVNFKNRKIPSSSGVLITKKPIPLYTSRGYPGWIWPIVWFLFLVMLDWVFGK